MSNDRIRHIDRATVNAFDAKLASLWDALEYVLPHAPDVAAEARDKLGDYFEPCGVCGAQVPRQWLTAHAKGDRDVAACPPCVAESAGEVTS